MRAVVALAILALVSGCRKGGTDEAQPAGSSAATASASASPSAAASASTAPAPLTPDQEKAARSIVANDCMACHSDQMLAQQRLTSKQWAAVVKKMKGWGSQVEDSNVDPLVAYLSARYTTDTAPYVIPTITAAEAMDALAKQPDGAFSGGDAKKGQALYKEACAGCHGLDAHGTATGQNLFDRPILYRAADFAEMIHKGRGRMPAFTMYKDDDIANIVAHLRSLGHS